MQSLLSLILAYPVYSWLSPSESLEQKQMRLIEEQNQIIRETNNTKLERYRIELIDCISTASGEILSELDTCKKRPKPVLQELVWKQLNATGGIAPVPLWMNVNVQMNESANDVMNSSWTLGELHKKVCQKQINSPLCKDRQLFDRLYRLTEERIPNKNWFNIQLWILNAESSLGTNFYPSKCDYTNNLAGKKWRKTDNNKSVRDQKIPDKNGCWLYSFESIEDFWISYTNTFRYGYKGCIDSGTPLACISKCYVRWDCKEVKLQWVRNASIFLE
jgi:hypothetical protein